jgi:hypothetical protein
MIVEKHIEDSVESIFDVYSINNNKWFIIDWSRGEIMILKDNVKLRRKFGNVYGIHGSGRWENENGIIIGYRDFNDNMHVVLYDINQDSMIEVIDKIQNGESFIIITDVILPNSWDWGGTLINSFDGYLYYNSNSFKKTASFHWVGSNDGRVFLVNDTILIGIAAATDIYGNYVILAGYYIIGQNLGKRVVFFFKERIYNDMIIGGDVVNNRILIGGSGDVYIFDIPAFNFVSKQKLINGNFIGADIIMLNNNFGYVVFSSLQTTKLYKFAYFNDRIILIDSLMVGGGYVKFAKFNGNIYLIVYQTPYDYGRPLLTIYKIKDRVTKIPKEPEIPIKFALYQNYPNPFNPTTTISYDLPVRAHVKLTVYNILGQEVATLVDSEQEPGRYDVKFDASGLPSGIYFYTLQTPYFTKTNKMVLIK